MDFLKSVPVRLPPAVAASPFWRTTYGGYTRPQIDKVVRQIPTLTETCICDPMSGQAYFISQLAWHGAKVAIADINPGALCLAALRDPELLLNARELAADLKKSLNRKKPGGKRASTSVFSPTWISGETGRDLSKLLEAAGVDPKLKPFEMGDAFWSQSLRTRLLIGLATLSARSVTCYRKTDNRTWLLQGGATPSTSVYEALTQALEAWVAFAEAVVKKVASGGSLSIATWDITKAACRAFGYADVLVVSPPYANRLDYASLWAPENALISAVFGEPAEPLKSIQVGSTVVKCRRPSDASIAKLPSSIVDTLFKIRSDDAYASARYYYPFFANYALSLRDSVVSWSAMLRQKGKMIVFVRDTVRKDHLFRTDELVSSIAEECGLRQFPAESSQSVIRHHVGLLRQRRGSAGLYGLAQREYCLTFQKS